MQRMQVRARWRRHGASKARTMGIPAARPKAAAVERPAQLL